MMNNYKDTFLPFSKIRSRIRKFFLGPLSTFPRGERLDFSFWAYNKLGKLRYSFSNARHPLGLPTPRDFQSSPTTRPQRTPKRRRHLRFGCGPPSDLQGRGVSRQNGLWDLAISLKNKHPINGKRKVLHPPKNICF